MTTGGTSTPEPDNLPMIMCGDLNSLPESGKPESIAVYAIFLSRVSYKKYKNIIYFTMIRGERTR